MESMKNRTDRILITGATGFVGRHLVPELLSRDLKLVCLVKTGEIFDSLTHLDVDIVFGDICEKNSLSKVFENVSAVIHLAAAVGNPNKSINFAVNVKGTQNIIDLCKEAGVKRLITYSSVSAKRSKLSAYAQSKKEMERIILNSGLDATVLRTEMIYGMDSRGLKKLIQQIKLLPLVIPIVGRGDIVRQPVFVNDVVKLTADILDNPITFGELFDVAGKERLPLIELIGMIAAEIGINKLFFPIPKTIALGIAFVVENIFKNPPFTYDNMLGITESSELDVSRAIEMLDFNPTPISTAIKISLTNVLSENHI